MPNEITKMFERLNLNEDMEMMRYELNKIMEAELSKPAAEVDADLVDEILTLLEAKAPSQEEQDTCWAMIQKTMKKKHSSRMGKIIYRCAAVAAAIVVMFFVSFGTASAFHWTFLLKLLAPVAETFGIFSTSNLEIEVSNTPSGEGLVSYSFMDAEYMQVDYDDLNDMPKEKNGINTMSEWMPERFVFAQGSVYEDPEILRTTVTYQAGEEILTLTTIHYKNDENVSGYVFERNLTIPVEETFSGKDITFYYNREEEQLSVTWNEESTIFSIRGAVSETEMQQIIKSWI